MARWESMTARDIMRTEIYTVAIDTPLTEVERLLGEYRIGGLPVTNETGHIVGVVSMRDLIEHYSEDAEGLARRSSSGFYHPASDEDLDEFEEFSVPAEAVETAGDIMTDEVYTVPATASLTTAAKRMIEHNVHRILVTEKGKKVGFISTMDILRAIAESD